eukprot:5773527-Prymnesium_polylepis.1
MGTPTEDKVKRCLIDHPWSWQLDFASLPDPSPSWFYISPSTLTHSMAIVLCRKANKLAENDFLGLQNGGRLPEAQQPRENLVWVHVVAYYWNLSRGWCDGPCLNHGLPLRWSSLTKVGKRGEYNDWSV